MLVILFRLLALCLTAPEKWKNFTGSPFGFLFHDSGYRESFSQVPKANVSVRTLLQVSNTCGSLRGCSAVDYNVRTFPVCLRRKPRDTIREIKRLNGELASRLENLLRLNCQSDIFSCVRTLINLFQQFRAFQIQETENALL